MDTDCFIPAKGSHHKFLTLTSALQSRHLRLVFFSSVIKGHIGSLGFNLTQSQL